MRRRHVGSLYRLVFRREGCRPRLRGAAGDECHCALPEAACGSRFRLRYRHLAQCGGGHRRAVAAWIRWPVDFTVGPRRPHKIHRGGPGGRSPTETCDLAICLEVAEHLTPAAGARLVKTLCSVAPVVLFSAAIPAQGGTNHINEQWQSHWADEFAAHGFDCFDPIRPEIWNDRDVFPWYRQNILLFVSRSAGKIDRALIGPPHSCPGCKLRSPGDVRACCGPALGAGTHHVAPPDA